VARIGKPEIFIWEALTARWGFDGELPPSLLTEGRAMRSALMADVLRIPGCRVITVSSHHLRRTPLPDDPLRSQLSDERLTETFCRSSAEEHDFFRQQAANAEQTWIIAPEIDHQLARRTRMVLEAGGTPVGPDVAAVELCSDKLRLAEWLTARNVLTLTTQQLESSDRSDFPPSGRRSSETRQEFRQGGAVDGDPENLGNFRDTSPPGISWPCVVKPRFGAGSFGCRVIRSEAEWTESFNRRPNGARAHTTRRPMALRLNGAFRSGPLLALRLGMQSAPATPLPAEMIVQPYCRGTPLSVAAVIADDGESKSIDILPLSRQRLSDDDRFCYLGGEIPSADCDTDCVSELVGSVCRQMNGLRGYVGFDLIVTDESPGEVLLVEINPRLTTSYIGYRELMDVNIAGRVLFPETTPRLKLRRDSAVRFFPDGRVERFMVDG